MNFKNYKTILCTAAAVTFLGAAVFCGFKIYSHYQQIDEQTEAFAEIAEVVENAEPEEEPPKDKDAPVSEGEDILAKYKELYLQNEDMVGWIAIDGTGIRWQPSSIPKFLSNRYYAGDSVHGQYSVDSFREKRQQREPEENWIIARDTHEPIVSKEIFEKTQQEMERRKAENKAAKSPGKYSVSDRNFFGKKIVCADCGKTMYLQRSGTDKAAFNCGAHLLKKQCFSHRIYDTDIYETVLKVIHTHMNVYLDKVEMIRRLNARQESIDRYDVIGKEIRRCHKELDRIAADKERLYEEYVSHIIDAEQYEVFKEQDGAKERGLRERIVELSEHRAGYSINFQTDKEWEKVIDAYRDKRKLTKKMVDAFVEKIEVRVDRKLTVHLYYDDMLEKLAAYAKEREAGNGK